MKRFFDTNILIYALDPTAGERHRKATTVIEQALFENSFVVGTQVLQEFASVASRKLRIPLDDASLKVVLDRFARHCRTGTDLPLLRSAIARASTDTLNLYDAIVVEGAIRTGCAELFSEDLQHGRVFGTLTVRNPFL